MAPAIQVSNGSILNLPEITVMADWAFIINYLSISIKKTHVGLQLFVKHFMFFSVTLYESSSFPKRQFRNRRFPKITGEDNLTVFTYSGRVKSPEWRGQRRRADLRHFEIFRHGPIIIYTRLPAGGTYYPICTFPASSECSIGISDAFSAFCLRVCVIFPTCSLYPNKSVPTLRYTGS